MILKKGWFALCSEFALQELIKGFILRFAALVPFATRFFFPFSSQRFFLFSTVKPGTQHQRPSNNYYIHQRGDSITPTSDSGTDILKSYHHSFHSEPFRYHSDPPPAPVTVASLSPPLTARRTRSTHHWLMDDQIKAFYKEYAKVYNTAPRLNSPCTLHSHMNIPPLYQPAVQNKQYKFYFLYCSRFLSQTLSAYIDFLTDTVKRSAAMPRQLIPSRYLGQQDWALTCASFSDFELLSTAQCTTFYFWLPRSEPKRHCLLSTPRRRRFAAVKVLKETIRQTSLQAL